MGLVSSKGSWEGGVGWREREEGRNILSSDSVKNLSSFCSQQTHTHVINKST